MPSAQVINFGEDPYANAMGGFARNFLSEISEKALQQRNENIFQKIKEKYGKDAQPKDIFRDVLEHGGLDPDYKRNKLNEIKEYAAIATRGDSEKPITPYQDKVLKNQEARLLLEKRRLDQGADVNEKKLPEYVNKYTSGLLKDAEIRLPVHDRSDLNSFILQLITEDGLGVDEAFNRAYDYIQARRDKVDTFKVTPRPSPWFGENQKELAESKEKAYQELKSLHDEDGIENQKELRTIAEKGGWKPEEITEMLQLIFKGSGKTLRGSSVKSSTPTPEHSANIPFEHQGEAAEEAGLDDILFGE